MLNLTLYSGSCRRKKQARTSSQWKLPLWVPIFLTVMLSVQRFFAWLDMYRGSMRVTSTERKRQQLACEFTSRKTLAGLLKFIWDVILVKLIAPVRTHHIQSRLHTSRVGGGQIRKPDRMWCVCFSGPKEPEGRGSVCLSYNHGIGWGFFPLHFIFSLTGLCDHNNIIRGTLSEILEIFGIKIHFI